MAEPGKLYLIPTPLGEQALHTLPAAVIDIVHGLDVFIVERIRTARRFIAATRPPEPIDRLTFFELNKRTPPERLPDFLAPAQKGQAIGLLSEAGCPGVADPGARMVALAHKLGIEVIPLPGPSSLLLALMASGFNGQQFAFHGYLSPKKGQLAQELRKLEHDSARHNQTQLFMETPYRNHQVLEEALINLRPQTRFCIAADLTLPSQWIRSMTVQGWNDQPRPDLHKRPAIFLLYAGK